MSHSMFDASGFDVLRGEHSNEEIAAFTEQIEELKQDPSFIMTLIQSFEQDQVKTDVFYQKEIIALIQNILKKHWYEAENMYTDEYRVEITTALINLLVSGYFASGEQMMFSYTFEFMSQKYFPQNIFVPEMLLETISQKPHNFNLLQYVLIACRSWFKTAGDMYHGKILNEDRDQELFANFDSIFDLSRRYLSEFEGLLEECINNYQNGTEYTSTIMSIFKILSSFLKYVNIPMPKEFFVSLLERFAGFLESTDPKCTEIQEIYVGLVTKANSEFFTKGESDSCHNKYTDQKREFAVFYNENAPTFCEAILRNITSVAGKTVRINTHYTHLIKQCLQFGVCTDLCLDSSIIQILIQLCILDTNTMSDAFNNPDHFIKCYLSPFHTKTIRSYAREIVNLIITDFDASEALIEALTPTDEDGPEVLDSKAFLLMMGNKTLLNRQSDEYESLKRRAKRSKKRVPPFRPHLALPEGLVSAYASVLEADVPLYLTCSSLYFLAHTLNFSDPEGGVGIALALIGGGGAAPAVVVLASKLFYRCYRVLEEKPEVDSAALLDAVIAVAQDIPTKALKKTVEVLVEGNRDLGGVALEVVAILLELARASVGAGEGDGEVSLEDYARSHLARLLNSVEDIVNQSAGDEAALAQLAPVVYAGALEIVGTDEDVSSEIEDVLMMLVPFSADLRAHPAEVFEGAAAVLEYLGAEEDARDQIVTCGAPAFVQWLYPLLVDEASPLRGEEDAVVAMVLWMHEKTVERFDTVDEFQLPYWLIMMGVLAQVYGLRDEYIAALSDAANRIAEFSFNHNEIRVLIAASIRLLEAVALLSPEAFASAIQNEQIVALLSGHCGQRFLVIADEIRAGIIALCSAARCGVEGAFEHAAHLVPFYVSKLEEEAKEGAEADGEDEDEGEGEGEEEDAAAQNDIAEAPDEADLDFRTETDNIAELDYPQPLDSVNVFDFFEQIAAEGGLAESIGEDVRAAIAQGRKILASKSQ